VNRCVCGIWHMAYGIWYMACGIEGVGLIGDRCNRCHMVPYRCHIGVI
jgi:hypothetical protein